MTKDNTPSFEQRVSVSSVIRNDRNRKIGVTESKARIPMMPFQNALGWSAGMHVAIPPIIWGLFTLLAIILGINFLDWLKPKDAKPDMTFVLVNDRNQKKPEHAIRRGEFNQHAGGKKRPDEDITPPEKLAASANPVQQQPKPQTKPTPPKPMAKPQPQQQAVQPQPQPKPEPKQAQKAPEKKPPMPKPSFIPKIAMPFKTHEAPKTPQNQAPTGPIAKASPRQASQASPASNPAPVQIASQGAMAVSSAASMGSSSRGNAQGGHGEEGVDVMADEDFGRLLADLQRRIKRNWQPPRGAASKRLQVKIVLARDGHVVRRSVNKSSGDPLSDDAALRAVDASAPFKAFPPQIRDDQVTIDFDFDYNVMSSPQRANRF